MCFELWVSIKEKARLGSDAECLTHTQVKVNPDPSRTFTIKTKLIYISLCYKVAFRHRTNIVYSANYITFVGIVPLWLGNQDHRSYNLGRYRFVSFFWFFEQEDNLTTDRRLWRWSNKRDINIKWVWFSVLLYLLIYALYYPWKNDKEDFGEANLKLFVKVLFSFSDRTLRRYTLSWAVILYH